MNARTSKLGSLVLAGSLALLTFAGSSCEGTPPVYETCGFENCAGCCSQQGLCLDGLSTEACGTEGASCGVCGPGQVCLAADAGAGTGGDCRVRAIVVPPDAVTSTQPDAGVVDRPLPQPDAGEPGSWVDAGEPGADAGAPEPDAGATPSGCGPWNCPDGCCSPSGACVKVTSTGRCGREGSACTNCAANGTAATCVAGECQPCAGCIDPHSGGCQPGTEVSACGPLSGTNYCVRCDETTEACVEGACQGIDRCSPERCPDGCCEAGECVQRSDWSLNRCGSGSPGARCEVCTDGDSCDAADAGRCVTRPPVVRPDAGLPPRPDAGTVTPGRDAGVSTPDAGPVRPPVELCVNGECPNDECTRQNCPHGCCDTIWWVPRKCREPNARCTPFDSEVCNPRTLECTPD